VADSRIDDLRRRLDRDPGSRLFAQLAEEHRKAGEHAEAIRVARAGLAQHSAYASARLTLGRALLDSGDAAGARVELETALREAPDNILASRFLGQALEALGELGPALLQLQKTLKMAPGDRQLESQIVSLQTRLGAGPGASPVATAPAPPPAAEGRFPTPAAPEAPAPGDGEPLPPTIRIHMPGDRRAAWERRPPLPPPLPATAAPAIATSSPAEPSAPAARDLGASPVPPSPLAPAPPPPAPPPPAVRPVPPVPSAEPEAPAPMFAEPFYESDAAPTLPTVQTPDFGKVDEPAQPTLPPGAVAAEETVFEPELPEPPPAAVEAPAPAVSSADAATPLSSSTLAELYLRQGLPERAIEVYRQLLSEEPGNARARARLVDIESSVTAPDPRAARRRAFERTIAGLESLLAALQRR
jgi:tetratricopeptide (TPR) repeat protein